MLLTMGVSLYTVRVVLDTIGVVDYGIYNVVGGVVTMFSFLSATLASASQRFFSFELGRKNYTQLKKTFSMTMTIYIMIAGIILVLAETLGLWFLNNKMIIPPDRMEASNWIYQFSIFSFMMTMFTVPYNAFIIAHERMKVYAYVSIIEVILKLVIVYLLVLFSFDKLKLYAVLMFGVTTLITLIYRTYCKRKFQETKYTYYWETGLFKELVVFSGWNLFGSLAMVFKNQGVNIVLNMFYGPLVNAAQGIAYQINGAINQFVINFSTAVNPQITKYYATGEKTKMMKLVFQSSKFSYFLMFILSMPLLLETNFILSVWLKEVPEYVALFTRLVIISAIIDSLSGPLVASALATGKIKIYQIVVGGVRILNFPVSYFFLKFGFPPQTALIIAIAFAVVSLSLRLALLKKMLEFPIMGYISEVIFKVFLVSLIAYIVPFFLTFQMDDNFFRFVIIFVVGMLTCAISIYFIGLSNNEKKDINRLINNYIINKITFIKSVK